MIKDAIIRLVEGRFITKAEAETVMLEIMSGETTPAQIAAYITALRLRGETPEAIAGSAAAMRQKFTAIQTNATRVVDTCGTGGDGAHTFNISTTSAFVAAAAGVTVAKHGNRSVSSKCGSADVLAALGVKIDAPADVMTACLDQIGIAFLFAPALHPAMKHAIGPRREIGIRTIFNLLGPLSNPAGAEYGVLGVYSQPIVDVLSKAAAELGARHLFVVHGLDGLDEITNTNATYIAEIKNGKINTYDFNPADVGIPLSKPEDIKGGDPEQNAGMIRAILAGEKGPRRDIVLLNSAAALIAGGKVQDFKEGVHMAANMLDSGAALAKLDELVRLTTQTS